MKIRRTYPQPDSPQPHIGPRERALAVLKYLSNIEPEDAVKHEKFELLVAAFEQAERVGWNKACDRYRQSQNELIQDMLPTSIVELITGETECDAVVRSFVKDGL